jgi:rubrerythrin
MNAAGAPRALLDDLERALRSEIGARTFYPLLARRVADAELAGVLAEFALEQRVQVERLSALTTALGRRARARCLRRSALAWALYALTFVGARPLALRLCHEAERTLARGYDAFLAFFAASARAAEAQALEQLGETKRRHARTLEAWVQR